MKGNIRSIKEENQSLATIYFPRPAICGEYRRRQFVSQSCSEWEGVVPNHISHQNSIIKQGV